MDPWEVAEAVPDAFTAPLPEPVAEEAPAPEEGKKSGRPRKEPADAAEAARLERERARKRKAKEKTKAAAAPSSPSPKERAQEAKAAAEEAPQTFAAEVPADPGGMGSMKLSKREAQAMLAQVFSLPAAMLEPQIFGCLLIPGKVATVKCTETTSIEVAIPEHLETTRKAAIEGLAILLDGQEIDPRYVAAGMVAVHAISVGAVYWQIADQMKKIRKEEAGDE